MVQDRTLLIRHFSTAGLRLVLADAPFRGIRAATAQNVFLIDIQRHVNGNHRWENFRIYPGHPTNRIEVLGTDPGVHQLVLLVHESPRTFQIEVGPYGKAPEGARKLSNSGNKTIYEITTPAVKRHLLCGLDERQLFVATLSGPATTVKAAHAILKSPSVTVAEGKLPGKTIRQGEWFFANVTIAEQAMIAKTVAAGLVVRKAPIGPGRNAHVAEELIRVPGQTRSLDTHWPIREEDVYVRGSIRHVDHKTVHLRNWRRVFRNTEAGDASGVMWTD